LILRSHARAGAPLRLAGLWLLATAIVGVCGAWTIHRTQLAIGFPAGRITDVRNLALTTTLAALGFGAATLVLHARFLRAGRGSPQSPDSALYVVPGWRAARDDATAGAAA